GGDGAGRLPDRVARAADAPGSRLVGGQDTRSRLARLPGLAASERKHVLFRPGYAPGRAGGSGTGIGAHYQARRNGAAALGARAGGTLAAQRNRVPGRICAAAGVTAGVRGPMASQLRPREAAGLPVL